MSATYCIEFCESNLASVPTTQIYLSDNKEEMNETESRQLYCSYCTS